MTDKTLCLTNPPCPSWTGKQCGHAGDQEKAKAVLATGRLNALPDGEGLRHIGTALGNWKRPVSEQQQ